MSKVYVKTDGPVPEYLTNGKVYEVVRRSEASNSGAFAADIVDDFGDAVESILIGHSLGCTYLNGGHWTLCDQHGSPVAEQKAESTIERLAELAKDAPRGQWRGEGPVVIFPYPDEGGFNVSRCPKPAALGEYLRSCDPAAIAQAAVEYAEILAERDKYKALAGELAEALRTGLQIGDQCSRGFLAAFQKSARTALAKYEQEQEKGV